MQSLAQSIGTDDHEAQAYIRVSGLQMNYDDTVAVRSLSLDVAKNEFVAVLGPSGCGKSTLLHALSGLMTPAAGAVTIGGHDVIHDRAHLPPIGYVFQEPRLLPWRSVRRNIELAMQAVGVDRAQWPERVERYLSMLRIDDHADSWPLNLSGGQQQRAAIARALAIHPAVVLMDEPFSTLDEVTGRVLRNELLSVWEQDQRTVIFVTHSIKEALFLADRVFILTKGPAELLREHVVQLPRPRDFDDPRLAETEAAIVRDVMGPWGYAEAGR